MDKLTLEALKITIFVLCLTACAPVPITDQTYDPSGKYTPPPPTSRPMFVKCPYSTHTVRQGHINALCRNTPSPTPITPPPPPPMPMIGND